MKNSRLRDTREAQGLRQLDLVIKTKLCPTTIWHAESGGSVCKQSRAKIARVLKVSVKDLWPEDSHEQKNCA